MLTEYNKAIRKAKRESFRSFCESIGSLPEAARIYKTFAKGKSGMVQSLRREDGSYANSPLERAELLLQTHFPGSRVENEERQGPKPGNCRAEDRRAAAGICTAERIRWALGTFQPYKSPGKDGIFPALLQRSMEEILPYLINIGRSSLALGYIPMAWRKARVVFIPKVGKRDVTHPKSFRPISLTSFVLKTLEKVVDNHIRCGVLQRVPLHPRQHAFRAGRSTETALAEIVQIIQKSLRDKEVCVCAFLDIEGAFDNTSHEAIERALIRRGVNTIESRWMTEVLRTRTAEAGDGEISVKTTRGCPQGGVLSPLMWSLVVDELLRELTVAGIDCQGYADDIVLIARGRFEETLCDIIQNGLGIVDRWCRATGLKMNPAKTSIVPFTRRRKLPRWRNIPLLGIEIPPRREVKYLGIILDRELTWGPHVETITEKARHALMSCRRLAGRTWGCSPRILYWMYIMMVRPIVTYGAVAWAERVRLGTTQAKLNRVQRMACVGITGAMRTCPTAALETLLDLSPLHLVVKYRAKEAMARIMGSGSNMGLFCSLSNRDVHVAEDSLLGCPLDKTTKLYDLRKRFTTRMSDKSEWAGLEGTYSFARGTIMWYTDGSKTESGTGAGVFGPRVEYSEPMGELASIFQAEIHAIGRCAQFNLDRRYKGRDIAILSDSQAAIRALGSYEVDSGLVWDCLGKLNRLGSDNKVSLCWVPGHAGIPGNERADELARRGASLPLVGPEPFCGLGRGTWRRLTSKREDSERRILFSGQSGLRQSKLLLGSYDRRRFESCIKLSRNDLRILTGLLTGHCRLNEHLYRMGIVPTPMCRLCDEEVESPEHILGNCGALMHLRRRYLGAYQIPDGELAAISPSDILKFVKGTKLGEIL